MSVRGPNGWDFTDPMRVSEVAQAFRVSPTTVARWAAAEKLVSIRTPGRQRRFSREQVDALIKGDGRP